MLPNVFEEYEVVYVFVASFGCSLSSSIGKRSTLGKISGAAALTPPLQFLRACRRVGSAAYCSA